MSFTDKIHANQIAAQKQGRGVELATLRLLSSEIHNLEIDKHAPLSDEEIITVIQRQIKKRQEAIALYRQGRREELARREEEEIQILNKYLPRQMTPEEVAEATRKIIEDLGGKDKVNFGQVMGQAVKAIAGKASGNLIAEEVKKLLSSS